MIAPDPETEPANLKLSLMFDQNALQQLSQLKSNLRSEKDLAQGTVRTTTRRFAFVHLDDGRDAFLPPDETMKVMPGDRVEVQLTTNRKDQLEAQLERLLSSEFTTFVGRYRVKGKAHFVEPDVPQFTRWLFIPPNQRKGFDDGDLIHCKLSRHPFHHDGKAQVTILSAIGKPGEPGVESRYITAKFELPTDWSDKARDQAQAINLTPITADDHQEDLTDRPFVTIDAETTRDMDDAVYLEAREDGWDLWVAIADPSRYIEPGTPLDQAAASRASTVYLLGQSVTMLPAELSHDTFSLVPDQRRPALVCQMRIQQDGTITDYRFSEALIRSHHKLSYTGVTELLDGGDAPADLPAERVEMLKALYACATARSDYRHQHALMMEDRPDYYFVLNDQKKIERIEKRERTKAHRIVEESMLATNICAGELFTRHPGQGIFSNHVGFRPERLDDAVSLLNEDVPDYEVGDLTALRHFQQLLRDLRVNPDNTPEFESLLPIVQRMLQAASLSADASEHFGLGFPHYATVTSPIRRYHDFYNHRAIKRILREQPAQPPEPALLESLQSQLQKGRQACRQLEQWLACDFVRDKIGSVHTGTIALVNSMGFGVRLDDWGIEGFVRLAKDDVKPAFDSRRLKITHEAQQYQLDQQVHVIIQGVDDERQRVILEVVDEATAERLKAWTDAPASAE
ncbi:VacB/RNase II family 3'-5' exoribonuclease [Marinimicrobium sp. LS-A18]|uniref:VacB/RNase II family 3'-5' exoribonuclease n=1 Tax=Marinimicrobium sp. LS-A18 TaxID=1381596 RepID=UPI0004BC9BC6|nr:VacB/RNase II family 3'-5' exoribonuclease [Marinimicrobium sp. LS-A18]